jgi:hypothetical protein
MDMLSNEFIKKYDQWLRLERELDEQLKADTDGRFGMCTPGHGVMFAYDESERTVDELVELVGPTVIGYSDEEAEHHMFMVGDRKCVIVLERRV